MNRRAFFKLLGGSLSLAGGYLTYLTQPALGSLLTPPRNPFERQDSATIFWGDTDAAWLEMVNGCAFVYAANVVAPQHRAHYLSKARMCLLRYKETAT